MNGSEADNYELRPNYSKEVLAKSVCQNGTKEEYQDTHLNCQQLGTQSLKLCLVLAKNYCIFRHRSPPPKDLVSNITSATIQSSSIGVVTGLQDIHHCVAPQRRIRVIHVQPYPIMRVPF